MPRCGGGRLTGIRVTRVDLDTFYARFAVRITVALNWGALQEQQPELEILRIASREALGRLGLPWYVDADQASCNFDVEGARRLTVGEAVTLLGGALSDRRNAVDKKAEELERGSTLALPAYSRGGSPILLDGCHRSLALMQAPGEIAVELCVIIGPDDPDLLADLQVSD
jgi:hypothetical protein